MRGLIQRLATVLVLAISEDRLNGFIFYFCEETAYFLTCFFFFFILDPLPKTEVDQKVVVIQ